MNCNSRLLSPTEFVIQAFMIHIGILFHFLSFFFPFVSLSVAGSRQVRQGCFTQMFLTCLDPMNGSKTGMSS